MSFYTSGDKHELVSKYRMAPQNYVWGLFDDFSVSDDDIMKVIDDAWSFSGVDMSYATLYKEAKNSLRQELANSIYAKYHTYYADTSEGKYVQKTI